MKKIIEQIKAQPRGTKFRVFTQFGASMDSTCSELNRVSGTEAQKAVKQFYSTLTRIMQVGDMPTSYLTVTMQKPHYRMTPQEICSKCFIER